VILVNGYIKPKIKTGGGFDGDGNPIPSGSTWGDPIPCRHKTNRNSFKGKSNGNTFIVAAYEIYIEPQPFATEQIQLFNEDDTKIGEYSIMWVEDLDAVEAIKITV
jgi:hypothetical protein